jgi:hypothetical protein
VAEEEYSEEQVAVDELSLVFDSHEEVQKNTPDYSINKWIYAKVSLV